MINTYFKLRLERELQEAQNVLRERILAEVGFADILKQKAAVYVPIDIGSDWNCTAGLSDPEQHPVWDTYKDYTIEIIVRHKTLPDTYWADLQLKVTWNSNSRQILHATFGIVGNSPTHVEYSTMLTALKALTTAVANIDFDAGTTVFGKSPPAP